MSLKSALQKRCPGLFAFLRAVWRPTLGQALREWDVIRQVGLRRLIAQLGSRISPEEWKTALPIQAPLRASVPFPIRSEDELLAALRPLPHGEGKHTIYLPPASVARSPFAALAARWPADAGLKICKVFGGVRDGRYLHPPYSRTADSMSGGHPRLLMVANLLHAAGIGPRLYDVVELDCAPSVLTAYVVEDVQGRTPTDAEGEAGIGAIRDLERRGILRITNVGGYEHVDLKGPGFNGNALQSERGFRYLDFQNFLLERYEKHLEGAATSAQDATHFGRTSLLRGGRYLYQSVPGLGLPAKRDLAKRGAVLRRLLDSAGVSLRDRLVLDVGCNVGMLMGQYLSMGARWAHGWDQAAVVPHAERLLLAVGCTRFSLTGGELEGKSDLAGALPPHARSMLPGCVVSYLAVRAHLGWLDALATLPWGHLIYEGHANEGEEETRRHLAELGARVRFTTTRLEAYADGDCETRPLALLTRS